MSLSEVETRCILMPVQGPFRGLPCNFGSEQRGNLTFSAKLSLMWSAYLGCASFKRHWSEM